MIDIFLATRNSHKVAEIGPMLAGKARLFSQLDFPGAPAVVEDASTFAGNAAKKAEECAAWLAASPFAIRLNTLFYVLADDSGLEVDALDGVPGVRSARFAATDARGTENSSDTDNNAKLLRLLEDVPLERRRARFRCALALSESNRAARIFEGTCEGHVSFNSSGARGFGYDPLFIPDGYSKSFAELGEDVKNKISHRARALALLRGFLVRAI